MVTLFSSNPDPLRRWTSMIRLVAAVTATSEWTEFENLAPSGFCSVVAIDQLRRDAAFPELIAFKTRHPLHPVILATRYDTENARRLKDLMVEEVLWSHELERKLAASLQRFCTHDQLREFAEEVRRADHLPPRVRQALVLACTAEQPIVSVKQLIRRVDCSRATLGREWRSLQLGGSLRFEDVLHWIVLLRAITRKRADRSWNVVAGQMGVNTRTLGRLAKQLTGRTLQALAGDQLAEAVDEFEREVMRKLSPPAP